MAQAVSEIIAKILSLRGVAEADWPRFLEPSYELDLHDPLLMTDMLAAVERIVAAAEQNERVVVYGDYDIDGLTASVILLEALAALGIEAQSYIPDRFEEGYGLNEEALLKLAKGGVQLVVTVDCGITSVHEAEVARKAGLDLVITDHHDVPSEIPEAVAVVNPKRPGDAYPYKDLCGAGVAFKLAQALQLRTGSPAKGQEKWLLDLVALGTVCDVVSLTGENRTLVKYGLKVLQKTCRPGIRELAKVGGVDPSRLTAQHLGFVLGPRMNAAGRLEHAERSRRLLQATETGLAAQLAQELNELNAERKRKQGEVFAAADAAAAERPDDPVLVLAHADWSHGVVGIVASGLAEKWRRPVMVGQIIGDSVKFSARSSGNFNMIASLRYNAELMQRHGGHFFAAGCTVAVADLDKLRDGLARYCHETGSDTSPKPRIPDLCFSDLSMLNWETLGQLDLLEPFGTGNPPPLFELSKIRAQSWRTMGKDGSHLRVTLTDGFHSISAVGFGMGSLAGGLSQAYHLTVRGELGKNEYQGNTSLQLLLAELIIEQD